MFVHALQSLAFANPDSPENFYRIEVGFLGQVPDWVALDPYFTVCLNGGQIVLPMESHDAAVQEIVTKATDIKAAVEAKRRQKMSDVITDPAE